MMVDFAKLLDRAEVIGDDAEVLAQKILKTCEDQPISTVGTAFSVAVATFIGNIEKETGKGEASLTLHLLGTRAIAEAVLRQMKNLTQNEKK